MNLRNVKFFIMHVSLIAIMISFNNCSGGFEAELSSETDSNLPTGFSLKCLLPDGKSFNEGESVTGFPMESVLYPLTCGVQLSRTCLNSGQFDGSVPVYSTCSQQCVHPDTSQPVNSGEPYVYFTLSSAASAAECDASRKVASCDQQSGQFLPEVVSVRYSSCKIETPAPSCSYPIDSGNAVPTGNTVGSTVTGYRLSTATYPILCDVTQTLTCGSGGDWGGTVPLYTACTQKCLQPDTSQPVESGTRYQYFTIAEGTRAQCDAALVTSACDTDTGQFEPAISSSRYQSCSVLPEPPKVELLGKGLPGLYYDGCVKKSTSDFFDTNSNTRLQPLDCKIVQTNPPLFSWIDLPDRNLKLPWVFTMRKQTGEVVLTMNVENPHLPLLEQVFPNGTYEWSVSYTNKSGGVLKSDYRKFQIGDVSKTMAFLSGDSAVLKANLKSRPRLVPEGVTMAEIFDLASSSENNPMLTSVTKAADAALKVVIPDPPTKTRADFTSDYDFKQWQADMKMTAKYEGERIEALALMYLLIKKTDYKTNAIQRLMALNSWDPDGASSQANMDTTNSQVALGLATGQDLLWDELTEIQRSQLMPTIRDRIIQALPETFSIYKKPYDSHGAGAMRYHIQTLLLTSGSDLFPEAADFLKEIWTLNIQFFNLWGGDDGSMGNSVFYSWSALTELPRQSAVIRSVTGFDVTQIPFVSRYGDYTIAFTAANILQPSAFGDSSDSETNYKWFAGNVFRMYSYLTQNPRYEWYWRVDPSNITEPKNLDIMHILSLGLKLTRVSAAAPTQNSTVFPDTGLVAIHDNVASSTRSSVFFRSSRLGSYNHSHADQNSFTYVSKGKALLISAGYYPIYLGGHHANVTRATRYKNALSFDGGIGQAESVANPTQPTAPVQSMEASGQLVNFYDDAQISAVTGDATLAYRGYDSTTKAWNPLLTSALRSIVQVKETKTTLIYDYAKSLIARQWELNFHSQNAFTQSGDQLIVQNGMAKACISVYNFANNFAQTNAWDVPPEDGSSAQYHGRFTASAKTTELVALTVVQEDCSSVALTTKVTGSLLEVVVGAGTKIRFDKATIIEP